MIRFKEVTKIYHPDLMVLDGVSFEVKSGEFVSIVGKSGAGKTTLLKMVLGMEFPTYGSVFFDNAEVNKMEGSEMQNVRKRIGGIYQDYRLLPLKTVYENVAYIMEVEGKNKKEIINEVPVVLEAIGLSDRVNNFPGDLSGGEQQRLAIARALVNNPEVIIADEPTGNLDPYNTYEVISLLEKINKAGRTVILSTHNREVVNRIGKRVITIEKGRVVRDDPKGRFII